ncbi:hypothetical protein QFZ42_001827 [Variovorax paradoxus]|uniref:hypothetical protein n=1 Tax=Variovorax paradoxus TaxID=34073 RepID=UPI00278EB31B|nr:hypothetical protein [Variovorax paradoxus]MDQ0569993.1 hypothetical protein [Variovorax paradoxus]
MNQNEVTQRLHAAEERIFALTLCLGAVLKYAPQAAVELRLTADHLEDAPPLAVSAAHLASVASHIRAALSGVWDDRRTAAEDSQPDRKTPARR